MGEEPQSKSIGDRVARGAAWTIGMRFVVRLFGFVNVAILARLLTKEDFGLVAIVLALSAFLLMALDTIVRAALIRQPDVQPYHYGSAFWLRLLGGFAAFAFLAAIAGPAATFYGEPELENAIRFFGLIAAVEGFASPWVIGFQRELKFHKDFVFESSVGLLRIATTIAFAFWLQSFWALLLGMGIAAIARVGLSHLMCWGQHLRWSRRGAADLWTVARWGLLDVTASFGEGRADRLLIGKMGNPSQLGVFAVVLDLVQLPIGSFILPIGRAILPGLQKLRTQASTEHLVQAYAQALGSTLAASLPVTFGMALVADPLVRTVLGDKWAEAAILIPLAAPFACAEAGMSSINQVLVTEGRFKRVTALVWARVILYLPAMTGGFMMAGVAGAVAAKSVVSTSLLIPAGISVSQVTPIPWRLVLPQVGRSLLACLVMTAVVWPLMPVIQATFTTSLLQLCAAGLLGSAVFGPTVLALWRAMGCPDGLESRLIGLVTAKISRGRT